MRFISTAGTPSIVICKLLGMLNLPFLSRPCEGFWQSLRNFAYIFFARVCSLPNTCQISLGKMESILKRIEESCSETESSTYDPDGNDSSDYADSDTVSEEIPSETSEDRAFVVSDTDQLSYMSSDSSGSYGPETLVLNNPNETNTVSCLAHHFATVLTKN